MTVVDVRKKKSKVVPPKNSSVTALSVKLAAEIRNRHVYLYQKSSKPARRPRLIRWSRLWLIKLPWCVRAEPAAVHRLRGLRQCLRPSNALTVETDLATGELAWEFNLGRCIFCGRAKKLPDGGDQTVARVRTGGVEERRLPATVRFALCNCRVCNRPSPFRKRSTTPLRCLSTTATAARKTTKASRLARNVSQKCLVPSDH
jgi:formate hydrogenlyase subunit 6